MKKPTNKFLVVEVLEDHAVSGHVKPVDSYYHTDREKAQKRVEQHALENPGRSYAMYELCVVVEYNVPVPVDPALHKWKPE